ncbi:MAG: hypothetical protein HYW49_02325 [Deltaproteobacteria bacterium]|nr:hypothetical protein [Deltaproteobacteria bacterium]
MRSRRLGNICILLSFSSGIALADAGSKMIYCEENLSSRGTLAAEFALVEQISKSDEYRKNIETITAEVEEYFHSSIAAKSEDIDAMIKMVTDLRPLIKTGLFYDAIAATAVEMGGTEFGVLSRALSNLRTRSTQERVHFVEKVIERMDRMLEQGMELLDAGKTAEVTLRWKIEEADLPDLFDAWSVSKLKESSELKVILLSWLDVVKPEELRSRFEAVRAKSVKKAKRDAEEAAYFTRISKGYTDEMLARNNGPIKRREFDRTLLMMKLKGRLKSLAHKVRYPNAAVFAIVLSLVPVSLAHAVWFDWNVTNTLATVISGIATCPPLIGMFVKPELSKMSRQWWIKIMTVEQLDRLRQFMADNPTVTKIYDLDVDKNLIDERIAVLRQLRYRRK